MSVRVPLTRRALLVGLAAPAVLPCTARAAETVKVAFGQRGAWDTSVCLFGQRKGFFRDAGLEIELLYTDGGTESQQAVISGGVDVGGGAGMLSILGAAVRNAPIRILSSNFRGVSELFWYARAGAGIASFRDASGKTVAWSTNGSSTNLVALRLLQVAGVSAAKGVATGNPVATLTQVMSGQIDIGYCLPPLGFSEIDAGRIVVVGRGRDIPEFRDQTVRCLLATPRFLEERRDQAVRFLQAYHRTIEWMYSDEEAIDWFAEGANATREQAVRARMEFYPKEAMRLGPPGNLQLSMEQAIDLKRIQRPLSEDQKAKLIQVVWEPPA